MAEVNRYRTTKPNKPIPHQVKIDRILANKPGEVIITKPADPAMVKAWHDSEEYKRMKGKPPTFKIPPREMEGPMYYGG